MRELTVVEKARVERQAENLIDKTAERVRTQNPRLALEIEGKKGVAAQMAVAVMSATNPNELVLAFKSQGEIEQDAADLASMYPALAVARKQSALYEGAAEKLLSAWSLTISKTGGMSVLPVNLAKESVEKLVKSKKMTDAQKVQLVAEFTQLHPDESKGLKTELSAWQREQEREADREAGMA